MSVRAPFSKSIVFKICRQKMFHFRVNGRPIRHIFHRFQNVPASCERSLKVPENLKLESNMKRNFTEGIYEVQEPASLRTLQSEVDYTMASMAAPNLLLL